MFLKITKKLNRDYKKQCKILRLKYTTNEKFTR